MPTADGAVGDSPRFNESYGTVRPVHVGPIGFAPQLIVLKATVQTRSSGTVGNGGKLNVTGSDEAVAAGVVDAESLSTAPQFGSGRVGRRSERHGERLGHRRDERPDRRSQLEGSEIVDVEGQRMAERRAGVWYAWWPRTGRVSQPEARHHATVTDSIDGNRRQAGRDRRTDRRRRLEPEAGVRRPAADHRSSRTRPPMPPRHSARAAQSNGDDHRARPERANC